MWRHIKSVFFTSVTQCGPERVQYVDQRSLSWSHVSSPTLCIKRDELLNYVSLLISSLLVTAFCHWFHLLPTDTSSLRPPYALKMQWHWYQQTAWERGGSVQQDINMKFWRTYDVFCTSVFRCIRVSTTLLFSNSFLCLISPSTDSKSTALVTCSTSLRCL